MKKVLPLFLVLTLFLALAAFSAEVNSPLEPSMAVPPAPLAPVPGKPAPVNPLSPAPSSQPPAPIPPPEPAITLAAVGDIFLGSWLEGTIKQEGPEYPWKGTEKILKGADIAFCNLESPLSTKKKIFQQKTWTLKAHPDMVKSLAAGGFKVATLANNHMMDFGAEALKETMEVLDKEGIKHAGAGMNLEAARVPAIMEIKGKKVAFLAYGRIYPLSFYAGLKKAGIAPGNTEQVEFDVKKAKETAQYVVVSFHWGAEMMKTPKDYQKALAHATIDAGADLVIGHHPHVLQGVEVYKGKVIAYSLGNFAFGSMAQSPLSGGILTVTFQGGQTVDAKLWPTNVNNHQVRFQPQLMEPAVAQGALAEIQKLSLALKTNLNIAEQAGNIEIQPALAAEVKELEVKSKEFKEENIEKTRQ